MNPNQKIPVNLFRDLGYDETSPEVIQARKEAKDQELEYSRGLFGNGIERGGDF